MANPLAPIHVPASNRKPKADARTVMRRMRWPMAGATLIAVAVGSAPLLVLGGVVWVGWVMYYLLLTRVLDPDGNDTPYVNQHSQIQAMAMRGDFARAAEAYRQVILGDPQDILACEHLLHLARKDLKDPQLAVWASREAERRHINPGRKLVFGMITAEICRNELDDPRGAVVELARLVASYPDASNAPALRAELDALKAGLFPS